MLMYEHAERLSKMAYHLCGRVPDDSYPDLRNAIAATLEAAEANGRRIAEGAPNDSPAPLE